MRAGRTCTVAGHKSHPYTFYIGVCNGGVWKTTDAGTTWTPIFDDQPTQSIGAIAIAPSNPQIIYVGSGEGLHRPDLSVGDGIYKSTDAGRTWTHLGLRDGQQITEIAVDPRNPDRLFVAVLGHPYGPNPERGIYRSTDGGRTFTQVLTRGENIGARDVDIDPSNPEIVYATFWEDRQGPWENAAWNGTGGGIFKSTDGGDHLAAAHERPAAGAAPCRDHHRAEPTAAPVRDRGDGWRRPSQAQGRRSRRRWRCWRRVLSIGRRRRDVDEADDRQPRRQPARLRIQCRRLSRQSR